VRCSRQGKIKKKYCRKKDRLDQPVSAREALVLPKTTKKYKKTTSPRKGGGGGIQRDYTQKAGATESIQQKQKKTIPAPINNKAA